MISVSIYTFNNQSVLMYAEHLSFTCKMTQFYYKFYISKMSFDLIILMNEDIMYIWSS